MKTMRTQTPLPEGSLEDDAGIFRAFFVCMLIGVVAWAAIIAVAIEVL